MYSSRTVGVGYVHRRLINNEHVDSWPMASSLFFDDASGVPGPRLLTFDMLVLEISLGPPSILWYRWNCEIESNLLWIACSLIDSGLPTMAVQLSKSRHNSKQRF